ncbi:hypothetical protein GN958_ATG03167 [Phytophthora infestans]|uniref:Uncharacterized protein n=1 Tax=Phytophthora infestans TaxID=4787 RepID=A0A8S9V8V0_PHYIN|nr:hypothetical protein GN958_ATG03167 [Phytophthora infestans]
MVSDHLPAEMKMEKDTRAIQPKTPSTRRRLSLDSSDSDSSDEIMNILLNTASKPAGRPREKKSAQKVKRRKQFQESRDLIQQTNRHGDIKLSDLQEFVDQKKLSL